MQAESCRAKGSRIFHLHSSILMLNLCGFAWIGGSLESRINPAGFFLLPTHSGDSAVAPFGTMGFLWIVGESVLEQDESGKGQVRGLQQHLGKTFLMFEQRFAEIGYFGRNLALDCM